MQMLSAGDQLYDLGLSSAFIGSDDIADQMDADVRYAAIYKRPLSASEINAITTKFSGAGAICTGMQQGAPPPHVPRFHHVLSLEVCH